MKKVAGHYRAETPPQKLPCYEAESCIKAQVVCTKTTKLFLLRLKLSAVAVAATLLLQRKSRPLCCAKGLSPCSRSHSDSKGSAHRTQDRGRTRHMQGHCRHLCGKEDASGSYESRDSWNDNWYCLLHNLLRLPCSFFGPSGRSPRPVIIHANVVAPVTSQEDLGLCALRPR